MQITVLGLIIIPLGAFCLFSNPKLLLWTGIFTLPWNILEVANFSFITFRLKLSQYLIILLAIHFLISYALGKKKLKFNIVGEKALVFFILFAFASLIMPILAEGDVLVFKSEGMASPQNLVPLEFRTANLTQLAYILFNIIFLFIIVSYIRDLEELKFALQLFVTSLTLIALLGLAGVFMRLVGLGGIYSIFSKVFYARKSAYVGRAFGGMPLMRTPFGEPGESSIFFASAFSMISMLKINGRLNNFLGKKHKAAIVTIVLLGILFIGTLLGGAAGIASLIGFITGISILICRGKILKFHSVELIKTFLVLLFIFLLINFILINTYNTSLTSFFAERNLPKINRVWNSLKGISTQARRVNVAKRGLKIFLEYPLLGVGVGSYNGKSYLVFLITNVGLLGTGAYFIFIYGNIRKNLQISRTNYHYSHYGEILIVGLLSALFGLFATGGWSVSIPWFLLGLLAVFPKLIQFNRE